MRDILITLIVVVGCLYTLKKTYIGILLWSWLSYMNPHRLAYGFAYSTPFAQITAIVLIVCTFISKQKQAIPVNNITIPWFCFILWMSLTTAFAFFPDVAIEQYIKVIKIQLLIFITIMLITDMEKLKHLLWVIVLSIGYYSVKGGIFTILTGGEHRVWGPSASFIEENNSLAIAVLMTIPIMIFLWQCTNKIWIKHGLLFAILTSAFTVFGSQSRGAFLAVAVFAVFYWSKSKNKIITGAILAILASIILTFMPESWHKRMETINTYEQDASAMGRLNAWEYAYNVANDNILGLGFESWSALTFAMYAPNPADVHAAHSIYFSVLADHGWIGLLLYLAIFFMAWRRLSSIIKRTSQVSSLKEIENLSKMMQASFIAYFVGGAFLSLSYFDLPWHLVSFVVIIDRIIKNLDANTNSLTILDASQHMQQKYKPNI